MGDQIERCVRILSKPMEKLDNLATVGVKRLEAFLPPPCSDFFFYVGVIIETSCKWAGAFVILRAYFGLFH
jgi:hypothetical protein